MEEMNWEEQEVEKFQSSEWLFRYLKNKTKQKTGIFFIYILKKI